MINETIKTLKDNMSKIQINWRFGLILLAIVLLIVTIIYVYMKHVAPKMKPKYVQNEEFVDDDSKYAYMYLFSAEWCPHCNNLKKTGVWEKFTEQYNNTKINGYILNIQDIDCSDDTNQENKDMLNKYEIEGYPSIIIVKDGDDPSKAIKFDAKPTTDSLNQFVNSVL